MTKATRKGTLTDKQELFCREYVVDLNATQAAIRAGYTKKSAESTAFKLLQREDVQKFVQGLHNQKARELDISHESVWREMARVAFSNIMDYVRIDNFGQAYFDLNELSEDQARALSSVEIIDMPPQKIVSGGEEFEREVIKVRVKLWDKLKALEMMARRMNMFEQSEKNSAPQVNFEGMDARETAKRMLFIMKQAEKEGPADPEEDAAGD